MSKLEYPHHFINAVPEYIGPHDHDLVIPAHHALILIWSRGASPCDPEADVVLMVAHEDGEPLNDTKRPSFVLIDTDAPHRKEAEAPDGSVLVDPEDVEGIVVRMLHYLRDGNLTSASGLLHEHRKWAFRHRRHIEAER